MKLNFLMGTATAATQIEGGDTNNNWYRFSKNGGCRDKACCIRADDHYNRYREDIDLMAEMGMEIYRFGVEWSRIEPKKGVFDQTAIRHYRDEIEYLLSKNIQPLLTLHHFTNPLWFEDSGAFEKKENVPLFLEFVEVCVKSFGDLVKEYITINEPNVYVTNSYLTGEWPPQKKSLAVCRRVMKHMAIAHIESYQRIHKLRSEMGYTDTKVSFANHLRVFVPKREKNILDRTCSKIAEYFFQTLSSELFMLGKFPFYMGKSRNGKYYDFIGINYYSRSAVKGFSVGFVDNKTYNDLGWEIYPEGLKILSEEYHNTYGEEVYITENGTCDKNDSFRSQYILDHLAAIAYEGSPVTRYYHWTFTDNFEWADGESACFGLVKVEYESQKRTVRESGKLYARLIRDKEISD